MPHRYVVLSSSLNPGSRSRVLAASAAERMRADGMDVDWVDLAELALPFCDGGAAYGDAAAVAFKQRLARAHGYLLATPIYNYDVGSALKNAVELTGRDVWTGKVVGFLCAAGGQGSYMAVMALANSLMLDFRTVVVPRFVYANKHHFVGDAIGDDDLAARVAGVVADLRRFTEALVAAD